MEDLLRWLDDHGHHVVIYASLLAIGFACGLLTVAEACLP